MELDLIQLFVENRENVLVIESQDLGQEDLEDAGEHLGVLLALVLVVPSFQA